MFKKVILLCLAVVFLSGCSLLSGSPLGGGAKPGEEVKATEDNRLKKFAESFGKVKGYHMTISDETGKETGSMTFQAPDKTHIVSQTPQGVSEIVGTEEATYIKNPGQNSWLKIPKEEGEEEETDMRFNLEDLEMAETTGRVVYIGEEACGNLTCYLYQWEDESSQSKMWFDKREFLLRRTEVTGMGDQGKMIMEYDYKNVTVTVPTENIEEFAMPTFEEGEMPSAEDMEQMQEFSEQFGL